MHVLWQLVASNSHYSKLLSTYHDFVTVHHRIESVCYREHGTFLECGPDPFLYQAVCPTKVE